MLRHARFLVLPAALALAIAAAQAQPGAPALKAAPSAPTSSAAPSASTEGNFPATQEQLLKLLRLSPTLTEVIARDPSLLSNQDYVTRNNPELGQFLLSHPEVARNPSFYLFTHLPPGQGSNEEALERKVWPDLGRRQEDRSPLEFLVNEVGPFVVIVTLLGALLWLIRTLLENRRWGRIFKLQTEVHSKLIERFGSSQELLTYMGTEAGNRFLQAAPIPVDFEAQQRMPNAVARVLTPLQIGIVLSLTGLGFYLMRNNDSAYTTSFELLAVFTLMPGLGFIISACITWVLAGRLGLLPDNETKGQNNTRDGQ